MNPPEVAAQSKQATDATCLWLLGRVRWTRSRNERKVETSEFDQFFAAHWVKLNVSMQRALVSNAIRMFLGLKRTDRNRHTVEVLIAAADDINCCPDIGRQTLLEYACGGSREVDLGIAKALLKAGYSLDRVAKGGLSPRQALENLYTSKKRHYDKCRILFLGASDKSLSDLPSMRRLRTPVSSI